MNLSNVQERYLLYLLLQKFYAGQLTNIDYKEWAELIASVEADCRSMRNDRLRQGFQTLSACTEEQFRELPYDFNRLFVGPGRLLAAPYESVYLNQARVLMQSETLAVRRFYQQAGVELVGKNHEPDDHIALELEFVCYLMEQFLETEHVQTWELLQAFLHTHLFKWAADFCQAVRSQSTHTVCLGMADLLEGMLQMEKASE